MICPSCKRENPDNYMRCTRCAARLSHKPDTRPVHATTRYGNILVSWRYDETAQTATDITIQFAPITRDHARQLAALLIALTVEEPSNPGQMTL